MVEGVCPCGHGSRCSGPTRCSVTGHGGMGLGLVLVWGISSGVEQGKESAEVWLWVSSASRVVGVE